MRAVLIGAGTAPARRLARFLIDEPEVESLIVIDPNPAVVEGVVGAAEKAIPLALQIGEGSIAEVLEGADVAIGCISDADDEATAASGAVHAGVHYVSASSNLDNFEALDGLNDRAANAGVLIGAGFGWTPGLTSLLAVHGAAQLTGPKSVFISYVVSGAGSDAAEHLQDVARSLTGSAPIFGSGSWKRAPAGSSKSAVYFPEPVGMRRVWRASGAEPLIVPKVIPEVRDVFVDVGLTEEVAARVSSVARRWYESVSRNDRLFSALNSVAGALSRLGGASSWSAARVEVVGDGGGSQTLGVMDQLSNLVAVPVMVASMMIAAGQITGAGTKSLPELVGSEEFLRAIAARGVRAAYLDTALPLVRMTDA
jgi:saccharopine dehydrogenase-like NADP-dependent oxidoreductase